jgi:hypothetical protein
MFELIKAITSLGQQPGYTRNDKVYSFSLTSDLVTVKRSELRLGLYAKIVRQLSISRLYVLTQPLLATCMRRILVAEIDLVTQTLDLAKNCLVTGFRELIIDMLSRI